MGFRVHGLGFKGCGDLGFRVSMSSSGFRTQLGDLENCLFTYWELEGSKGI